VADLYAAYSRSAAITTQHIVEEIKATQPLSVVMAEQVNSLRQWAQGRTVTAN
jgi:hypothetical protein